MKQWIVAKRRLLIGLAVLIPLLVIGYLIDRMPLDKHWHTPQEVITMYEKAIEERDGLTIRKVATDEQAKRVADTQEIDLFQPMQKSIGDLGYLMKEYQMDGQEYWYKVSGIVIISHLGLSFIGFITRKRKNGKWKKFGMKK